MANISVVGRIVSDDIELKISANNRPYLRFDLAERTGKGAYARTQYYQVVAFGAIAIRRHIGVIAMPVTIEKEIRFVLADTFAVAMNDGAMKSGG